MWRSIDSYSLDADGLGHSVPVAWRRDGGAVVRMASGSQIDNQWNWQDPMNNEELEPPDFWFDMPPLRQSEAWVRRS